MQFIISFPTRFNPIKVEISFKRKIIATVHSVTMQLAAGKEFQYILPIFVQPSCFNAALVQVPERLPSLFRKRSRSNANKLLPAA